jgi:hypothetical protein
MALMIMALFTYARTVIRGQLAPIYDPEKVLIDQSNGSKIFRLAPQTLWPSSGLRYGYDAESLGYKRNRDFIPISLELLDGNTTIRYKLAQKLQYIYIYIYIYITLLAFTINN